jgi:hypothetical protein
LGREDATDIKEVEARDVVKCPARHRTVWYCNELSETKVHGAAVEIPWYRWKEICPELWSLQLGIDYFGVNYTALTTLVHVLNILWWNVFQVSEHFLKWNVLQAQVTHACNHSYLEAKIGRISVPGHPEQKSLWDPISTVKEGHGGTHLSSQLWQTIVEQKGLEV